MDYLTANWPAPTNVFAFTTTRKNGISQPPYDANNLAKHVGDDEDTVEQNRLNLMQELSLPSSPEWLDQTHSSHCVVVENDTNRIADAAVTRKPNTVLTIMTADCLPIVICNTKGNEIAAIHAGWRGLLNGVVETTLRTLESPINDLLAWVGPAICQRCYETGEEVKNAFISKHPATEIAFQYKDKQLFANLPQLAEIILQKNGVQSVFQSNQCTYEEEKYQNKHYFSYRRQNPTGRIATLIWFK